MGSSLQAEALTPAPFLSVQLVFSLPVVRRTPLGCSASLSSVFSWEFRGDRACVLVLCRIKCSETQNVCMDGRNERTKGGKEEIK